MKYYKSFLLFLFLFFILFYSYGQVAWKDAITLKRFTTKGLLQQRDSVFGILKNYIDSNSFSDPGVIVTLFNKEQDGDPNPFLEFEATGQMLSATSLISRMPSSLGNLNVTTFADGLAKFLVERTKEELAVAFFRQFKEDMEDERYSDLHILFPQTKLLLTRIDDRIYQFSTYLNDLRDAFIVDLNNIPFNCPTLINQPKYAAYFNKHPEFRAILTLGALITHVLLSNDRVFHPGKTIDTIDYDHFFIPTTSRSTISDNLNGGLKTLRLISNSLRSFDTTRFWINSDSLSMVINDDTTFNIYLGLLFEKSKQDGIFFKGKPFHEYLANMKTDIEKVRRSIFILSLDLKSIDVNFRQIRELKRAEQVDTARVKDSVKRYYYAMYSSTLDLIESGTQIIREWKKDFAPGIDNHMSTLRGVGDIYLDVTQKKYSIAILSVVKLTSGILDAVYDSLKFNVPIAKVLRKMSLYGTFVAGVAKAENSDQVKEIITRTVLPTGSSYIKKQSRFNIALNAYTGLYGGKQRQRTDTTFVNVGGVYAPVGIAVSKSFFLSTLKRNPWAASLFISIIDVGPLVSYRFTNYNDTLANDIQIRLNQIFSPGIHAVLGLPKVPVSFGFGGNWSPLIAKVEKEQLSVQPNNKRPFRWQIFLAVDIPLLNFHNKPR